MISIMTNETAVSAQRNLEISNDKLKGTISRLASGSRIVQASDDPAGLAISDGLNASVRSLGQAIRNAQDGVSLVQVYEGGTNEINSMLIRIREIAMQAASDTIGDPERAMLNNEVSQLSQEIDRTARTTMYNGKELLAGGSSDMDFQVGTMNRDNIDRINFAPGDTDLTASALGVEGISVSDRDDARGVLETIDKALNTVNETRARVGASQSRLQSAINSQSIFQENLLAAKSRIRDTDVAKESTNLASEQILRRTGAAVLTQANQSPALALQLLGM